MPTYIALLRGINVSGHHKVPMVELKQLLENNGYRNVQTILASGSVVLEHDDTNLRKLEDQMAELLSQHFGFEIPVIMRTSRHIDELLEQSMFHLTPHAAQKYVTFCLDPDASIFSTRYTPEDRGFEILGNYKGDIYWVRAGAECSGDGMNYIEKTFKHTRTTTRNLNTLYKIQKLYA